MIIISIINIIISIIIINIIIIIDVTIMELAVASYYYYHMYRGIPEVSFTGQVWGGRTPCDRWPHTRGILTYVCGHLSHKCSFTSHLWPVNDTSGITLYIRW